MKRFHYTLMVLLITLVGSLQADQPSSPQSLFFMRTNRSQNHYLVSSLQGWTLAVEFRQRVQVFGSATGELRWEVADFKGTNCSLFLADDGDHLISVSHRQAQKPGDQILDDPVIRFYRRDKLIKTWTPREMGLSIDSFQKTSSHELFWMSRGGEDWYALNRRPNDLDILSADRGKMNPFLHEFLFRLSTFGGFVLTFDIRTGEIASRETFPPKDRDDPFDVD